MHSQGRVFSRSELLDKLYQHGEVVIDRVIDVHIGKLRQKIEPNPAKPYYIETVRGFGYRFRDNDAEKQA
jgi:DNA-binding response OmpR family regulator